MLPARWQELQPLLDTLLDADVAERTALLAQVTQADPSKRSALEHLLAECGRDMPMLDHTAVERFNHLVNDESSPELAGTLGGRYRIQRELGRGGMARVYLAEDLKHSRDVAVKVIRPELAASLGRDRFLREIGIAARLRHPNIMPLFDSGDADGVLYFVMPYEPGPSLRTTLTGGHRLSITDALSTLRDVAKALAYAHEQGVVHRDVKPDNVMLSGGTAVVTDFGIAKAVSAAQGEQGGTAITQNGVGIGTPAYMAPEQAVGDPTTDHRSDIYSFGCLAYELFVGVPPFVGASSYEIISAHMRTTPNAISALRSDVPEGISVLVQRCLEKNPADRPQNAQALLAALELPPATSNVAVVQASSAWRKALMVAVPMILVAGFLAVRMRLAPAVEANAVKARMLVVLPMENRTGDATQTYIATGMADDIARRLEGIGGIKIRSGARSEWPTATRHDLELVANKFGSTYLLKTVLEKKGDSLDLSAFVVDVTTTAEKAIARRRFALSELRTVERDFAARIAAQIFRAALPTDPRPAARPPDPESYRLTLEGWHNQMTLRQRARARDLFQRAVELDPLNARAWAGLSSAWYSMATLGQVSNAEGSAKGEAAALHALALDPMDGSALAGLGMMRAMRYRSLSTGLAFVQKGIESDPGNPEVFQLQAALYRNAWRWDDSRDALRFAEQLDPISPSYALLEAQTEICAGRASEALGLYETILARSPTDTTSLHGKVRTLALLGRFDAAITAWKEDASLRRNAPLANKLSLARGASGYWDARHLAGKQRLAVLADRTRKEPVPPRAVMLAEFAAGEFEHGFRDLERLINDDAEVPLYRLPCIEEFDEVRRSPRFAAIQAKVGHLPP